MEDIAAKYIFRLDDICENMNWNNYLRIKDIFLKHKIRPVIGVIPDNQDKELIKYLRCSFDFWSMIKDLQHSEGWSIALHGYNHVYESNDSGILKVNKRSEFAGLSKYKQNEKIDKGINIMKEKGINIDAFMAPAHSFDKTTIECLKDNGINIITDGYALFPYYEDGILFIPQLFAKPRKMPYGVYTWCLHLNVMSDSNIKDLEVFIQNNIKDIISFFEAKKYAKDAISYKVQNFLTKILVMIIRRLRALKTFMFI